MAMPLATKHRDQIRKIIQYMPSRTKESEELKRAFQNESESAIVDPAYFASLIQKAEKILSSYIIEEKRRNDALQECQNLMTILAQEAALNAQEQARANFPMAPNLPGLEHGVPKPEEFQASTRIYYPLSDLKNSHASIFVAKSAVYLDNYNSIPNHLKSRAAEGLADAALGKFGEGAEVKLTSFDPEKYTKGASRKTDYYKQCNDIVRKALANGLKIHEDQLRHIDPKVVQEGKKLYAERNTQRQAGNEARKGLGIPEAAISQQNNQQEETNLTISKSNKMGGPGSV